MSARKISDRQIARWDAIGKAASYDEREVDEWAARELKAFRERTAAGQRGGRAALQRQAAHTLVYCSGEGQRAPWRLVELIMELLDARVPPDVPVSLPRVRAWRIFVASAAKYPEPPKLGAPTRRGESPQRCATLKELCEAAAVDRNTGRQWLRLPQFQDAHRKVRERNAMSLTQQMLTAPIDAQKYRETYRGANFLNDD